MATIRDVARLAGVSVATVSRVLNEEGNVLPETEERVKSAIQQLSYSPNLLGRNLRRGATQSVLVLLNTIANPFYAEVVRGAEERLAMDGFSVMLNMTHGSVELERQAITLLQTKLIDGAIFLSSEQPGPVLTESCRGIPVVQACEPQRSFLAASVAINNRKAAFEAVSALIAGGNQRIAFVGASRQLPSSAARKEGYREALDAARLPVDEALIVETGFSIQAGQQAAEQLLRRAEPLPDAVFCISDSAAVGVIHTLVKAGIRVPEDVSVMGFDDAAISEAFLPSIATVQQPRYEIGYKAAELLLRAIRGEDNRAEQLILTHKLIRRESAKFSN